MLKSYLIGYIFGCIGMIISRYAEKQMDVKREIIMVVFLGLMMFVGYYFILTLSDMLRGA